MLDLLVLQSCVPESQMHERLGFSSAHASRHYSDPTEDPTRTTGLAIGRDPLNLSSSHRNTPATSAAQTSSWAAHNARSQHLATHVSRL